MRIAQAVCISLFLSLAYIFPSAAQERVNSSNPAPSNASPSANPAGLVQKSTPTSMNDVLDRVVQRERQFVAQMRQLHPLVETYLQYLDNSNQAVPTKDLYFLGRLNLNEGPQDVSFMGKPGLRHRIMDGLTGLYSMHFLPLGFAQMTVLDTDFEKRNYNFTFVRREFLGEIRCLVFDLQPRKGAPAGRFIGRIWVEDQDFNIVRANGTYYPQPRLGTYLHFDSWRLNMRSGTWLPAYIYSEESDLKTGLAKGVHFKAQTRLWGYDLSGLGKTDEFTQILVDSNQSVKDQSDAATDASPVMAQRMWEKQAEDNVLDRMSAAGLLAPPGDVDKVLQTVVTNLLVSNNIDFQQDLRCRVLLTAPIESFTIGNTIVVSRGMLDVLPDEASLAMVLADELSHILLGDKLDTTLAFNDKMFFPDEKSFQRLDFKRDEKSEAAADAKALELLKNSPYKDKLGTAGLFLKELQQKAPDLPNLIRPHMGNALASGNSIRMSTLLASAPALDEKKVDQIAALPLGGRIKLDPWSDRVELEKAKPVALNSAREKMPFEVTPFFPYLTRLSADNPEKVASTGTAPAQR